MLLLVSILITSEAFNSLPIKPIPRQSLALYGGKSAKFGLFSPAVYGAKAVLGEGALNKVRGKGIGLHSQVIGDFVTWCGAYHLRVQLIKKAKKNGDILGFLV